MLQVGDLANNRYRILREVGHGGMSVVYLAIDEYTNKIWAVKEVRKDGVCDFEIVKQSLVVETDMLKKLSHPHLPNIVDVIDTEDCFLIVMDFIEGRSLESIVNNGGAQPMELVVEWGRQLCEVLGYLHSREPAIIYRDMKPANVILKPDGNIMLIDFGTAREYKNREMAKDTTCLGTRGYAAPEQFGGLGQSDVRTDIYCLGATLYHLLTGHNLSDPPYIFKKLGYWNPAYAGTKLESIISKCCQQDPDARYQSCRELLHDLNRVKQESTWKKVTQPAGNNDWKRKWYIALIAAGACLAVIAATCLIVADHNKKEREQKYLSYIEEAKELTGAEDFDEFVELIQKAVTVDPSRYEAYDALISQIENDGKLDPDTELSPIESILQGDFDKDDTPNEDELKNESPENYSDIQFRAGKLLFLMSPGGYQYLAKSAPYFHKALADGTMENSSDRTIKEQAKLAKSLAVIGSNIEGMDKNNNLYTESEYSYTDLWTDLQQLYEENSIDSMGSKAYGVALYETIAYLIGDNYAEFTANGISSEEILSLLTGMETVLEDAEGSLTTSEINRGIGDLIIDALTNVTTAKNRIEATL